MVCANGPVKRLSLNGPYNSDYEESAVPYVS